VAQFGAALGRQFSFEVINAVAQMPPTKLEDMLAPLVSTELILQSGIPPHAEYTFKHALVQDAAMRVESERLRNQTVLIPMNWEVRCDVSTSTQPRSEPLPSPMIFVGALTKLLGRGRVSGVGAVRARALWADHPAAGDGRTGRKGCIRRFRESRRLGLMRSVLISLRMSARANLLATLPAPITAIAELVVVPVLCQLTSAQAQSRRRPICHILGL
jgi:hypothetical protein